MMNEQFTLEKVDPKGIIADAIYVSFSGVIECAEVINQSISSCSFEKIKISKSVIKLSWAKNGDKKIPKLM